MYVMSRRYVFVLLFFLCAASLCLHFTLESLGPRYGLVSDWHEEDQFMLGGQDERTSSPERPHMDFRAYPSETARPLAPLLQPPIYI